MFKALLVMKAEKPDKDHDLEALHKECVTQGFTVDEEDASSIERTIRLLNAAHKNYQNRYHEKNLYSIDPRDATHDVEKLLKRVKKESKAYLAAQVAAHEANLPTGPITINTGWTVLVGRAKPPSSDPNA
jgi:HEPN domain-containing protein